MIALFAAFLLVCPAKAALDGSDSSTLAVLKNEAAKDPASAQRPEDVKNQASQTFSGDAPAPTTTLPTGKDADGQSYLMVGQSRVKGINIYTPKLDPSGHGVNPKPVAKDPIGKKKILAAAVLGAAAIAGGIMTGGTLGGFLLAAGGAFLGIAAVLGFLRHKLNKSKA